MNCWRRPVPKRPRAGSSLPGRTLTWRWRNSISARCLDGTGELDRREVVSRFDAAAEAFRTGGHAFGDALVMWSAARWLLAYGQSSGLDLARAAAGEFAAADVPSSELQVWQALQAWYTAHGDPGRSRQARSHAARLVPGMGFALAAEVRVLDEANQAFRSGNVARARSLLARRSRTAPGLQAASRLMLATSANAVGLRAEALELLEGVVRDLTAADASLLLGEALALLATMLSGADNDRAAALLRQAADVARAAESPAEEAKYRAQLGWLIVTRRMAAQLVPSWTRKRQPSSAGRRACWSASGPWKPAVSW